MAFPLLSAGIFRGHVALDRVVELACRAVATHDYAGDVYLCGFLPAEQTALRKGIDVILKEGLVLPLDCVHQRAARAEREAQRAYKLRRRAEELAQRGVEGTPSGRPAQPWCAPCAKPTGKRPSSIWRGRRRARRPSSSDARPKGNGRSGGRKRSRLVKGRSCRRRRPPPRRCCRGRPPRRRCSTSDGSNNEGGG